MVRLGKVFADACFACRFCHEATVGLCCVLLLHCPADCSIIDFAFLLKQAGLKQAVYHSLQGGHSRHVKGPHATVKETKTGIGDRAELGRRDIDGRTVCRIGGSDLSYAKLRQESQVA